MRRDLSRLKVRYRHWWFRLPLTTGRAVVLYPWVLFREPKRYVSETTMRHELQHVYQVWDMGWLRFYVSYLWLLLRHGYKAHPYEIEARAYGDSEPLTPEEREVMQL